MADVVTRFLKLIDPGFQGRAHKVSSGVWSLRPGHVPLVPTQPVSFLGRPPLTIGHGRVVLAPLAFSVLPEYMGI